ncbi:GTPase Era [Clostridiales bacterium PH28_bin88]|nr:GTPase Era [Clostridiales bacterium PH28_bin88]
MGESGYRSGFASIIGRPNVGKSTLLNRLVGQKVAIMSDKPQTTRHKIQAVLTTGEGQVVLIDTPGIHKPKHRLGEYMVEVALKALREVDLILYVVDAGTEVGPGEQYILERLAEVRTPVFLVVNKIDLVTRDHLLGFIAGLSARREFAEVVPVSALTGENLERLAPLVMRYLPEGPQYYPPGMITDQPERFVMAELIREKALMLTRQEVPHALAVVVTGLEERPDDTVYVEATIYTERESQKGIMIGKQGQMLKEIGRLARQDMENLMGSKVFLDLRVRVKKDWRRSEAGLRYFGYDRRGE